MPLRSRDNRTRYDALAGAYEGVLRVGSLGRFERLHRAVAEALGEIPGGTILDLGCGPGNVTPHLLRVVGPAGRVVGIDFSRAMIDRARRTAERAGWTNARFECRDAMDYRCDTAPDAVVLSLSLSTMPDPVRCLERAIALLAPGGRLALLDSIPERSRPLARLAMHLKAPLVGARPSAAPLEVVRGRLEEVRIRRFLLGVYMLVSARKPDR